LLCIQVPD
jgi:hypothetical protein